jgi:hypothetical protein
MNKTISSVTSNPLGAIVGGVAVFYGAKRFANVSNTYVLIGATVLGIIGGAMAQKSIQASMSKPTAKTTK